MEIIYLVVNAVKQTFTCKLSTHNQAHQRFENILWKTKGLMSGDWSASTAQSFKCSASLLIKQLLHLPSPFEHAFTFAFLWTLLILAPNSLTLKSSQEIDSLCFEWKTTKLNLSLGNPNTRSVSRVLEDMDRINELSDELLVKILLLVPTKVAVSTSLLSKRWEFLWMWLPKLKYGYRHSSASESEMLQCFLNKNLPLHRAPVIECFSLDLTSAHFKPEDIKLWVVIAISHNVRKLKIKYASYPDKPNILPSNLYICKSLVLLKLSGLVLLDVPRMVSLPSLKTLKLRSVSYSNEESLQRLLSNCPILEDLMVILRENDITGKLSIAVPSLQRLSLGINYGHNIEGIVIATPSLKYLDLGDYSKKDHYCLIENMPNLFSAYIEVDLPSIKSIIRSITHVKHLTICSEAMYDGGFVFKQLKLLKVCRCQENSSNLLVRLLKDSPNLQGLEISIIDGHEPNNVVDWNLPRTVPKCILSSLQTLKWSAYTGKPGERDLAVCILQNARHLKIAKFKSLECDVPKLEMLKELARSSRASRTCQLIFD